MLITNNILADHHVLIASDNEFQREARLRQTLWRMKKGLPIGEHRGRQLGSRLAMPFAEESLANYLTHNIRDVVRAEVKKTQKLYQAPRIYNDLLSSQPLCFNLFGELQLDLDLATEVFGHLLGEAVRVKGIAFEHSPGRGDSTFTGDRSAFDVYVTYEANGRKGFLGIEVKYVEDLGVKEARHRSRYDEIAKKMGSSPRRLCRGSGADLLSNSGGITYSHARCCSMRTRDSTRAGSWCSTHPAIASSKPPSATTRRARPTRRRSQRGPLRAFSMPLTRPGSDRGRGTCGRGT